MAGIKSETSGTYSYNRPSQICQTSSLLFPLVSVFIYSRNSDCSVVPVNHCWLLARKKWQSCYNVALINDLVSSRHESRCAWAQHCEGWHVFGTSCQQWLHTQSSGHLCSKTQHRFGFFGSCQALRTETLSLSHSPSVIRNRMKGEGWKEDLKFNLYVTQFN